MLKDFALIRTSLVSASTQQNIPTNNKFASAKPQNHWNSISDGAAESVRFDTGTKIV